MSKAWFSLVTLACLWEEEMDGEAHTGWRSEPHLNFKISLVMDVELILIFLEHHQPLSKIFGKLGESRSKHFLSFMWREV